MERKGARPRPILLVALASLGACAAAGDASSVLDPDAAAVSPDRAPSDAGALAADAPEAPAPIDVTPASDAPASLDAAIALDAPATPDAQAAVVDAPAPSDARDAPTASDVPAPCGAGQIRCAGACTVIQSDPTHCGACGQACATGERCEAGVCRLNCPAGRVACVGADGSSACVDLASDGSHCGGCARACRGAERCVAGACVSSCASGETACGGACVNTATSDQHCGACDRRCADGQTCIAGVCRPRCAAPAVLCGDVCDDVTSSPRNCGACGWACPAGQSCALGRCTIVCPAGQTVCNARCYDLQTDPANCGMCGRRCASGGVCAGGACTVTCASGQTSCDGACVDTRASVDHCGACGNACAARPNATARCAAGRCAWSCQSGSGDCDGVADNGCETSLASTSNCGACGNACRVSGSGIARCAGGVCGVLCLSGRADCDGSYANGCEVDTRTSTANCGACGRACPSGSACVAGVCSAPTTRVLEDFESTTWPRAPWTSQTSTPGTRATSCAHDGAAGLQDPGWTWRTDLSVGATGERLSMWVRGGTGRAYLGFGATSAGAWSFVAGFNTDELLIQRNEAWGYATQATAAYAFATGTWYRIEITFNGGGAVTGRLYSASGATLATVSATLAGLTTGGIALRAFGSTCIDTIERR